MRLRTFCSLITAIYIVLKHVSFFPQGYKAKFRGKFNTFITFYAVVIDMRMGTGLSNFWIHGAVWRWWQRFSTYYLQSTS